MNILILAYLLSTGEPVMETVHVPVENIQAFFQMDGPDYPRYNVKFRCMVAMKKEFKGHYELETPQSCSSLQDAYHKKVWGK